MQNVQPSLLTRPDTILGACEGIGEDFGFNPLYLRVVLAAGLLVNPLLVIGSYAVLALAVFVSRRIVPNRAADVPSNVAHFALPVRAEAPSTELAAAA